MKDSFLKDCCIIAKDTSYSVKSYGFRRCVFEIILKNLLEGRKVHYKVAKKVTILYNDYFEKYETVESLFDMSILLNIPHNNSLEIDLKMSQNTSSIPLLYDFIEDVLSRKLED